MYRLTVAALVLACSLPTVTHAQFKGMRSRVPKDANTLVLMNADKMFGSKVAAEGNWKARRKAAFDAGLLALPPDATEILLAGRQDLEYGDSVWELALVKLLNDRNVSTIAARFGGSMDTILGRSAARLPNDQYVVQITPNMVGSYTPANRQDVSRWLRSTDQTSSLRMSPYLDKAFGYATEFGTPVVMAIDLEGMVSAEHVKGKIEFLESLKGMDVPVDQFVKVISSIRGVTLGVTLVDQEIASIRVDFAESPMPIAKVAKPLLIEVLQRQGAMIDEIREWTPSISGNTFFLKGKMGDSGNRRVLSVLELPQSLSQAMQEASSPGADPEGSAKLLATQQYWQSVTTLLEDLRIKPKRDHVKTFGQAAIWYDKYARKIDNLPILNVDEEMLNFGVSIASMLRDCESTMKGVGMRTSLRTASNNPTSGGFSYSSGGYRANTGYYGVDFGPTGSTVTLGAGRASLQAKSRSDAVIRGQERTAGASTVQGIWQQIDEMTAETRRKMVNKYSADF